MKCPHCGKNISDDGDRMLQVAALIAESPEPEGNPRTYYTSLIQRRMGLTYVEARQLAMQVMQQPDIKNSGRKEVE